MRLVPNQKLPRHAAAERSEIRNPVDSPGATRTTGRGLGLQAGRLYVEGPHLGCAWSQIKSFPGTQPLKEVRFEILSIRPAQPGPPGGDWGYKPGGFTWKARIWDALGPKSKASPARSR